MTSKMKGFNPNYHGTRSILRIFAITMALMITSVPRAAADDQQSPASAQSDITHYIWVQNQDYSPGAEHTLYWSYDSGSDHYSKTLFFYLEKADGSGDRQYLNVMTGQMSDEAIDAFGNSPADGFLFQVSGMGSINKLPLYTGSAPSEAGLWHWVAEIRDSTAKVLVDSSWAKFVVYDEEVTLGTAAEGEEGDDDVLD